MTVDEFVVAASNSPDLPSLNELLQVMAEYVQLLEASGHSAVDDPAVLLLGAYISFHTHSDINTVGGYKRLVRLCEDRIHVNKDRDVAH